MSLVRIQRGGGEPLVLIHGIGGAASNWDPVIDLLAAHHEVFAIDLPGFGASAPLADGAPATIPSLAGAVERELDSLGIDRAHICGNSMGGWIALELAARGRALTCVAISPVGRGRRDERALLFAQLSAGRAALRVLPTDAVVTAARTSAGRQLLRLAFARPANLTADQLATFFADFRNAPGFPSALRYIATHTADNLDTISCPTRIVWGTRDHLIGFRQAPRFVDAIGDAAQLHPLDGLGHTPMSDDPVTVAAAIVDFTTSKEHTRAAIAS